MGLVTRILSRLMSRISLATYCLALGCLALVASFFLFEITKQAVFPQAAFAQDFQRRSSSSSLFAKEATVKANEVRLANKRGARVSNGRFLSSGSLAQDLRIDTVNDILLESKYDRELFSDYRGLDYLRYVGDVVEVDEIEQSSLTQKLILFQTARTVSKAIVGTPLENHYRRLVRVARKVRDYTTLRLVNSSKGTLGVQRGDELSKESGASEDARPKADKEELVEFKLHASASNGLEPRLKFSENLTLRLDPLSGDALLEFKSSF